MSDKVQKMTDWFSYEGDFPQYGFAPWWLLIGQRQSGAGL